MKLYGITGTNGKTTTTWILHEFLGRGGYITTVEAFTGKRRFSTGYTTPPLPAFKSILAEIEETGGDVCAMEVSSHAIHQRRTGDAVFAGAGFTNLSEDHLDYHKTMDEYFRVKAEFFVRLAESTPGAVAAICTDGEYGRRLAEMCRALPLEVKACGLGASDPRFVEMVRRECPLVGGYNVQNVLVAAELARGAGVGEAEIVRKLALLTPRWGRLERVRTRSAAEVFVDYAHTDDALANVLGAVREFAKGEVWAVFGAGGDRDRAKRPLMGAAASKFAEHLVVTSDNPRSEDPAAIIAEILGGVDRRRDVRVEPDRRAAIFLALEKAQRGDVVVVCGKGHETTQTIGSRTIPFDDRKVCAEF